MRLTKAACNQQPLKLPETPTQTVCGKDSRLVDAEGLLGKENMKHKKTSDLGACLGLVTTYLWQETKTHALNNRIVQPRKNLLLQSV